MFEGREYYREKILGTLADALERAVYFVALVALCTLFQAKFDLGFVPFMLLGAPVFVSLIVFHSRRLLERRREKALAAPMKDPDWLYATLYDIAFDQVRGTEIDPSKLGSGEALDIPDLDLSKVQDPRFRELLVWCDRDQIMMLASMYGSIVGRLVEERVRGDMEG